MFGFFRYGSGGDKQNVVETQQLEPVATVQQGEVEEEEKQDMSDVVSEDQEDDAQQVEQIDDDGALKERISTLEYQITHLETQIKSINIKDISEANDRSIEEIKKQIVELQKEKHEFTPPVKEVNKDCTQEINVLKDEFLILQKKVNEQENEIGQLSEYCCKLEDIFNLKLKKQEEMYISKLSEMQQQIMNYCNSLNSYNLVKEIENEDLQQHKPFAKDGYNQLSEEQVNLNNEEQEYLNLITAEESIKEILEKQTVVVLEEEQIKSIAVESVTKPVLKIIIDTFVKPDLELQPGPQTYLEAVELTIKYCKEKKLYNYANLLEKNLNSNRPCFVTERGNQKVTETMFNEDNYTVLKVAIR